MGHSQSISLSTANKPRNDFHDRLMQMELIYQHLLLTKTENSLEPVDEKELQAAENRLLASAGCSRHIGEQSMFRSNSVYAMYMREYEHIRKSREHTDRVAT